MRSVDAKFQSLAFRYLRKQCKRLLTHAEGIRAEDDIEHVHQARVASRRLRTGLGVFAEVFPAKTVRRWNKHLRRLTKGLGDARDKDVQIAFVDAILDNHPADQRRELPGLKRLHLRLNQQREAAQPRVIETLDQLDASGILPELLNQTVKRKASRGKGRRKTGNTFVWKRAARDISKTRDKLLKLEPCLEDTEAIEQHHEMRLAAKRLRYMMEIYKSAFDGRLNEPIKAIRALQTLLGDIHDCDVWVVFIEQFSDEERQRSIDFFGHARNFGRVRAGLEFLRDRQMARRLEAFEELVVLWNELQDNGLWERLEAVLKDPRASIPWPSDSTTTDQVVEPTLETIEVAPDELCGQRRDMEMESTRREPLESPEEAEAETPAPVPAPSEEAAPEPSLEDEAPAANPEIGPTEATSPTCGEPPPEDHPAALQATGDVSQGETATCDCCGQNGVLRDDLARIDSGQLLCPACLDAFQEKIGGS